MKDIIRIIIGFIILLFMIPIAIILFFSIIWKWEYRYDLKLFINIYLQLLNSVL